ncbi:MAG: hypothetical protein KC766_20465 [Myxococcales bacterium]|nr:hypothetical protein [Myxococcales bacterium]
MKTYLVRSRHLVCYLARELTGMSYPELGRQLGRDHTTVMHSCAVAWDAWNVDELRDFAARCRAALEELAA